MKVSILLLSMVLLGSCASATNSYGIAKTAAEIGCSEKNTIINESTWNHRKMAALITYDVSCKDKVFKCMVTGNYDVKCRKSID